MKKTEQNWIDFSLEKIQDWDFGDGKSYFYISNRKYLEFNLDKFFDNIETGRVIEKLMNVNLDFLVAFCRNPKVDKIH